MYGLPYIEPVETSRHALQSQNAMMYFVAPEEEKLANVEACRRKETDGGTNKAESGAARRPAQNFASPRETLVENAVPITEQCKSIQSQQKLVNGDLVQGQTLTTKPSLAREKSSGAETRTRRTRSASQEDFLRRRKFQAYQAAKAAMFKKQYQVWEAERKPRVEQMLHRILSAVLAVYWLGWNESLIWGFIPYYCVSYVIIRWLTQLTVPMFHSEGLVMRKLTAITLFQFTTSFLISISILLSLFSDYGNFYVVEDAAAAHPSMKVLQRNVEAACELECARRSDCYLYQHKGGDCRLFNTTPEQADVGALDAGGSTLALKKIVHRSQQESDGQLYHLSGLVNTGPDCSGCREVCEGYFHVANFPRPSDVIKEIVERGDALDHAVLYEEGSYLPLCWNSDDEQDCKLVLQNADASDASRFRIYYEGQNFSNFTEKTVKVLCQANPLGRREFSRIKRVYDARDIGYWFDSIVTSNPMLRMIATALNEELFKIRSELYEVWHDCSTLSVQFLYELYAETLYLMEDEE